MVKKLLLMGCLFLLSAKSFCMEEGIISPIGEKICVALENNDASGLSALIKTVSPQDLSNAYQEVGCLIRLYKKPASLGAKNKAAYTQKEQSLAQ